MSTYDGFFHSLVSFYLQLAQRSRRQMPDLLPETNPQYDAQKIAFRLFRYVADPNLHHNHVHPLNLSSTLGSRIQR